MRCCITSRRFRGLAAIYGPGSCTDLDRATSGLMVVAKNDGAHRKLARQFSGREVHKTYVALVHGWPEKDRGTFRALSAATRSGAHA